MSERKIRMTPVGLVAMPESYDPSQITQDALEHDSQVCTARVELETLWASSEQCMDQAVATAGIGFDEPVADQRIDQAGDARAALGDLWDDVLDAADRGDIAGCREALQSAQSIERDWGSDAETRAALALLEAA